ncbi:dihydrofolate reductase family protein [Geodermatophilus sp. SYSU D00758]
MRKIVLHTSISLDGFFEGPDGDIGWHRVDDELHSHFNEELAAMSAFLEGRRTYQLMEAFWPTADADPAATGPMAEFADIWRRTPKLVFSRTLDQVGPNAELLREVDADRIRELAAQPGGDMALGGADLAAEFRRLDLVDEYRLYVHPVLLGRGRPLFGEADRPAGLRLVETRTFGNGVVQLRHAREAG